MRASWLALAGVSSARVPRIRFRYGKRSAAAAAPVGASAARPPQPREDWRQLRMRPAIAAEECEAINTGADAGFFFASTR